ncbi:MAG: hypothetical protein ACREN2_09890 [Candidatus Dormibacteria bacterium]
MTAVLHEHAVALRSAGINVNGPEIVRIAGSTGYDSEVTLMLRRSGDVFDVLVYMVYLKGRLVDSPAAIASVVAADLSQLLSGE